MKTTLILVFLLKALMCYSCDCIVYQTENISNIEYEIEQNGWIGLGRIINVNRDVYPVEYDIDVSINYKGSEKVSVIQSGNNSMDCGFKFEIGEEYVVYGMLIDSLTVFTTNCHRTNKVVDSPDYDYLNGKFKSTKGNWEWSESITNYIQKKVNEQINMEIPPIIFDSRFRMISIIDLIGMHPNYYKITKYNFGSGDLKRMDPELRELAKARDVLIIERSSKKVRKSKVIRKLNNNFK